MDIPFTCTIVNVLRGWSILLVSDSDGGEIIESRGTGRYSNLVGECMKFIELREIFRLGEYIHISNDIKFIFTGPQY